MMRQGITLTALCGLLGLVSTLRADDRCCDTYPTGCPASGGHTVCRPVTETKTVTKRKYTDVCEDFCLPCSVLGMLTHRCDCSRVMTRKYMVLKLHKHEQCVEKCIPVVEDEHAPACQAPCGTQTVITHPASGVPVYSPLTPLPGAPAVNPAPAPASPATMPRAPVYAPLPSTPASSTVPMGITPPPMQRIQQAAPLPFGR